MKTISIHSSLVGIAAAALAGAALALPLHHAEARKVGGVSVRDHRASGPIARDYRSLGAATTKLPGGMKPTSGGAAMRKLKCVGPYCPGERPSPPRATTTGTNKANPSPVGSGSVVIRDHRRPTCYAPGRCKPARFYIYNGQRYLLRRNGS